MMDGVMAHAIHRPLNAEGRVRSRVSLCGNLGGQSGTGTGFYLNYSVLPVNIIPPVFSILMYHLWDEQYVRW
jgi:hypothetical protein